MALLNGNVNLFSRQVDEFHYAEGFRDAFYMMDSLFKMLHLDVASEQTLNPHFSCVPNKISSAFNVTEMKNIIHGLDMSVEEEAIPYLISHEKLFKIICDARTKLNEYFEPTLTEYFLNRTYDPETQSEGLILEIHTDQNFDDAMACLEQFEDDWWLDNMPTNGDKFVIDVVFA